MFDNFFLSLVSIKKFVCKFLNFCLNWLLLLWELKSCLILNSIACKVVFVNLTRFFTHGFSLEKIVKVHILERHSSMSNDKNNNIMYMCNKVVLHSNCPPRSNVKRNTFAFSTLGESKLEIIQGSKWCKRLE